MFGTIYATAMVLKQFLLTGQY